MRTTWITIKTISPKEVDKEIYLLSSASQANTSSQRKTHEGNDSMRGCF